MDRHGVVFDGDRYFQSMEDLIETYADRGEENLPEVVWGTELIQLQVPDIDFTALDIHSDWEVAKKGNYHNYYPWTTAESLLEWAVESLDVEWDLPTPEGIEDLNEAIANFKNLNVGFWQTLRWFAWFDPSIHSVGKHHLEAAIASCFEINSELIGAVEYNFGLPIPVSEDDRRYFQSLSIDCA